MTDTDKKSEVSPGDEAGLPAVKPGKRRGRPPYQRDEKSATQVATMVIAGVHHEVIAKVIGISLMTLYKYYRKEIDEAISIANAQVARSLYSKATGNGPMAVTAAIFWLKCRAGWKEPPQEHSGPDGGPMQFVLSRGDGNL